MVVQAVAVSRSLPRRVMPVPAGGVGGKLDNGGRLQPTSKMGGAGGLHSVFDSSSVRDWGGIESLGRDRPPATDNDFKGWWQKALQRRVWADVIRRGEKSLSFTGCYMGTYQDSIEVHRYDTENGVRLGWIGFTRCGNPWICPVCAPIVGAKRIDEIVEVSRVLIDAGYSYVFPTFTFRHGPDDKLSDILPLFSKALRYMKGHRAWRKLRDRFKIRFEISTLEITFDDPCCPGVMSGPHPHRHSIYWLERPFLTDEEVIDFQLVLSRAWQQACRAVGLDTELDIGVHVETVQAYAKRAGKPVFRTMSATQKERHIKKIATYFTKSMAFELTGATRKKGRKGRVTPWDLSLLMLKGDQRAERVWLDYVYAMRRKTLIRFSPGLKDFCGLPELADKELVEGKRGDTLLKFDGHDLPEDAWRPVACQGRLHALMREIQIEYMPLDERWKKEDKNCLDPVIDLIADLCGEARENRDILTGYPLDSSRLARHWPGSVSWPSMSLAGFEGEDVPYSGRLDAGEWVDPEWDRWSRRRYEPKWRYGEIVSAALARYWRGDPMWSNQIYDAGFECMDYARSVCYRMGIPEDLPMQSQWLYRNSLPGVYGVVDAVDPLGVRKKKRGKGRKKSPLRGIAGGI